MSRNILHSAGHPAFDDAAHTVISARDFSAAISEIKQWEGYSPTPVHSLSALAASLGVGAIHYKDEGSRFGLGSFKALGGAYAAQQVLRREISRVVEKKVSLADVRERVWREHVAGIRLVTATDGNHGQGEGRGFTRLTDEGSGRLPPMAASICRRRPASSRFQLAPTVSLQT